MWKKLPKKKSEVDFPGMRTKAGTRKVDEREAVLDELGDIQARLAANKPLIAREEALKEEVRSWFGGWAKDKPITLETGRYIVTVGECEKKRVFHDMLGLSKALGKRFFEFCTFPLAEFDKLIPDPLRKNYVTTDHVGKRSVRTILRPANGDGLKAAA